MRKKQIEQRLRRAGAQLPLPGFEAIADAPVQRMEEPDYITRQVLPGGRGKAGGWVLRAAGAVCALLVAAGLGWFAALHRVDSLIYLDVNPSLQIAADRQQRVLRVTPLNEDAQALLGGTAKEYKGQPLEQTVGRLAERLAEDGYLTAENGAVLLSVQNSDGQRAMRLEEELAAAIESHLAPQGIHPAILRQQLAPDRQAEEQAAGYGISPGKLWYARQILAGTDDYTLEQLAGMKLEQLVALAREEAEEPGEKEEPDDPGEMEGPDEPEETEEPEQADEPDGPEPGERPEEDDREPEKEEEPSHSAGGEPEERPDPREEEEQDEPQDEQDEPQEPDEPEEDD
ncbi:hypothetical protein [Allofournierella sp.]|uniref:anti-sigma-I factor RsgI family protein n=1 Tax=Allofournierella sp. TaxID=1940256 RepID=UPI003AB439E6